MVADRSRAVERLRNPGLGRAPVAAVKPAAIPAGRRSGSRPWSGCGLPDRRDFAGRRAMIGRASACRHSSRAAGRPARCWRSARCRSRRGTCRRSAELAGPAGQLAESQARGPGPLAERLQAQERAITKRWRSASPTSRSRSATAAGRRQPRADHGQAPGAACRHRRGAEEHHRAVGPGGRAAGHPVQQAGARRVRRDPAPGPRAPSCRPRPMPSRRRSATAGAPTACCGCPTRRARSRSTPSSRWRATTRCATRPTTRPRAGARAPSRPTCCKHVARYRRPLHRARRDRRIGADVPALARRSMPSCTPTSPTLVEKSYRARVWIVSPTTLMATLNTVRAVLKDARMREQAGRHPEGGQRMLEDVAARRAGRQAAKPFRPGRGRPAQDPYLDRQGDQARRAHRGPGLRGSAGAGGARRADRSAAPLRRP